MMKRNILPLVMLLASTLLYTSCLDSDDDYVYNDDAAITAFTLGDISQTFFCKTKDGLRDSSYVKSVDYSEASITIDHLNGKIYNNDSLPYGVNLAKVLATVSTRNSGTVGLKNVDSDTLHIFSSSDTVDFTKPRELFVYSNSGLARKVYTVTLTAHLQDGDQFVWKQLDNNTATVGISTLKDMRLAALADGKLVLAGTDGNSTHIYASADGHTWTETTFTPALDATAYAHMVTDGTKAWLCSGGQLYATANGTAWTHTATAVQHMVAAGGGQLFAYSDGKLMASADGGTSWTAEEVDDADAPYLPSQHITSTCTAVKTNNNVWRVLMAGSRSTDAYPTDTADVVWGKIIDADNAQPWVCYYDAQSEAKYRLPRLAGMQIANSKTGIVAFGGKGIGACNKTAQQCFWNSGDNGLTWMNDTIVTVPEGFSTNADACAFTIDADNYVWLVCGTSAQVWRGRLNKLGWAVNKDIFEYRDDKNQ